MMRHRIRAAALITKGDRILLVCHQSPTTQVQWWIPPGGGLEATDDSIFACAERETLEETGLTVSCSRIAYLREFTETSRQIRHLEVFVVGDRYSGELTLEHLPPSAPDSDWIVEARWVAKTDLQNLLIYPEILKNEFWDDLATGFIETKYLGHQYEEPKTLL